MPPYPALPASPVLGPTPSPNNVTVGMAEFVCDQLTRFTKCCDEDTWAVYEVKEYMRDWADDWVERDLSVCDLSEDWPAAVGYMMIPFIEEMIDWKYVTDELNSTIVAARQ